VLLRIPTALIEDVIIKKYEVEDEDDDMDDEQDLERVRKEKIAASKKRKLQEKTIALKEWNVKLYFKMILLFGSIALANIAYVSYGLSQLDSEVLIFDTIKDLDVVHQDVYESVWEATELFGYCEPDSHLCDDFHHTQEILEHTAEELNENFHVLLERDTGALAEIFYGAQCLSKYPFKCDKDIPIPDEYHGAGIPTDYAHFTTKGLSNLIDVRGLFFLRF
jgi:hypothetical protein